MNVGDIFVHMVVAAMGAVFGAFLALGFIMLCYLFVILIRYGGSRVRAVFRQAMRGSGQVAVPTEGKP